MNPLKTSFSEQIQALIVEYHKLYHEFKRPEYLEIAKTLGQVKPDTFTEDWKKRVNQKCVENNIPLLYP